MKIKKTNTLEFTQISILIAIMIVMMLVPFLGYIPVPFTPVKATTMHIPVIIGAILMGPKVGGILGGFFGLTSFIVNSFLNPTAASFLFSPIHSMGDLRGSFYSIIICFVPRILIGVVAGYLFILISKFDKSKVFACIVAALAGSLTNTILVLTGAGVFFGERYATVIIKKPISMLFDAILGIISFNGVIEAILATFISTLISLPLIIILKKNKLPR